MTVNELYEELRKANASGTERFGVIVFSKDNWSVDYSLESRSYKVSSECRRFKAGAISNSVFGDALDGTDNGVRLDLCIAELGWRVDTCYMLD